MPELDDVPLLLVCPSDYLSARFGEALTRWGFDIQRMRSAADCLDRLDDDVRVIVSSHRLPDVSGLRLLRSVRATRPNVPFVLAPEDGSEELASEAVDAGVSGYVTEDDDVESAVSRIVESVRRSTPWVDEERGRRYSHLVDVAPVPINLFDRTGETIWCNDAVLDLLGLESRNQLIGNSIFEFIHPDDHEVTRREIERVTEQREAVGPTQMRVRRADGETRHIYVSTAIGQFLGENIGQAIAVDVTRLRETREELREQRRFIDTALDSLEDVFYVTNDRGELLRWNETATSVTGLDETQMEGALVADFVADEDRDRIADSIAAIVENGSDRVEARVVDRDGQRVPYEFRGRRLRGPHESGETRIVGVGRDVTVQKERERQLQILERWLRHNIRNDVNVIQGLAERMRRTDGSSQSHLAEQIVDRADHLIDQADKEHEVVDIITKSPPLTPVSVGELVERQVNRCRERHSDAEVELSATDSFRATSVPQLELAVAELLDNAIRHNDSDPPRVSVELAVSRGDGTIRIADNGPGIPQMELDEVFLDPDVDQLHHGSGLGISVAYWVARHSDGRLSVSENSPRGSVVELTLPTVRP